MSHFCLFCLLLAATEACPGQQAQDAVKWPGPQPDGSVLLHNQWSVRPAGRQIELGNCGFNFGRRGIALNGDGEDQDAKAGMAAGYDAEEVANDGAGWRGDDTDGAREGGERLLAIGVEQAYGFKALLQLLEG